MCGLFGIIGPGITRWDLAAFHDLGIVNMLRGTDSAGVLFGKERDYRWSKRDNRCLIKKTAHSYADLLSNFKQHGEGTDWRRGDLEIPTISDNYILGHTRHATKGDTIASNAHPFETKDGKIAGMHNGTIKAEFITELVKDEDERNKLKYGTDSEALLNEISRRGIQEVVAKLNDDEDSFAIVWVDKEAGRVFFTRNKKRGLAFAVNGSRHVMYYSSELDALRYVLRRNDIKAKYYFANERFLFEVNPDRFGSMTKGKVPWKGYALPEFVKPELASEQKLLPLTNVATQSRLQNNIVH